MHLKTWFSSAGIAMALFIAGAGWGLAFDKAKLDTFLTTNACKYCDLTGADLSGRDMRGADLENARLGEVNLSGSDLSVLAMEKRTQPANLESANLRGADLSNANLVARPRAPERSRAVPTWCPDVRRFLQLDKPDEVFGTHSFAGEYQSGLSASGRRSKSQAG